MTIGAGRDDARLAARRFKFWDNVSHERALDDFESRELERAMRELDRDDMRRVRAQAPRESKRGTR